MPSKTKSSKAPPSSEPLDDLAAEPPTEEIDPYAVLSVARDATDDQIKKAYRKAALKHHPGKLVPFATSRTFHFACRTSAKSRPMLALTLSLTLPFLPQTKQPAPTPPQPTQTSNASPSPTPSSRPPPGAPTTISPAPPPPPTSTPPTATKRSTGPPSSAPPTQKSLYRPSLPSARRISTRMRNATICYARMRPQRGTWTGCMRA